ncbi:MAG: hypothetical protein A4E34_01324 [Methanoregula sp. PtaU1.Bin006]|nr:MAG: hypothetical protein A4E33_01109 [Methanoregula sp. PtaB.Bin085]OPY34794.1 MAG: hypothetical protein A4E34_01324 [Methanoregula sp. PtaU1.Bin006]
MVGPAGSRTRCCVLLTANVQEYKKEDEESGMAGPGALSG